MRIKLNVFREMSRLRVTPKEVADVIGVKKNELQQKLNGKDDIWIDEADDIHKFLKQKGSEMTLHELFS